MLVSYNWLKSFLPLKEPPEQVIDRLIQAGVAVEGVRHPGRDITRVVVAELLSVEKHPQADRLSLTKVSDGKSTHQVVCGAKNIAPGQKVPLAQVGAVLPGGFEIKAAKIRNVESFGMLCSAKELALAEDAEGILILPPDAPVGADFLSYAGLPDTLFELEITPNRSDLLSHLGVAREIGAILHRKVAPPSSKAPKEGTHPLSKSVQVSIEAKDLCPLYTCRVLEGVKVGPSPRWLSSALERLGHRSINNIVDVTNYVLFEMGQPLHAFDLDGLKGAKVVARKAKEGERIPLLDGSEKALKGGMLVIADAERPVALAGVMGGSNSQVTDGTTRILLEAALFQPGSVRKTARALGLSTDSSYRFERGVDPQGVEAALQRAAALILQVAGGTLAKGIGRAAGEKGGSSPIAFRPGRTTAILGLDLPTPEQLACLKALGCKVQGAAKAKKFTVQAPSYRLDLTREIDLIEEIARLTGYDRIPVTPPAIPSALTPLGHGLPFEGELRSHLRQAGFSEAVHSTFLPPDFGEKLRLSPDHPLRKAHEVTNPIAEDQRVLRPTLLPSLLEAVRLNLSHQQEGLRLYEWDKVFFPGTGDPVRESLQVAAVVAGIARPAAWEGPERKADFFDLKGLAEALLCAFDPASLRWEFDSGRSPYAASPSLRVTDREGRSLLWGGALEPKVLKNFDITVPCFALEMDLPSLAALPEPARGFRALPRFPQALRDIALVVPDGVTSTQVLESVREQGGPDLKDVRLFDLYRGTGIAPGARSLAYRLTFQNQERTLTDQEVSEKVARIIDSLQKRYSIALR